MSNDPNIKQLQDTINDLTQKVEQLEKEKEEIIENFQVSTNVLLEKIKDLEAANLGSRPQTALILKKLDVHSAAQAQKIPHLLEKSHNSRPAKDDDLYMKLQHDGNSSDEYESPKISICPNCKDKISSNILASHTIECYRNSTKCKICGEVVKKSHKKTHLDAWRSKQKVKEVLQKDNDIELTKILEHGLNIDYKFDEESFTLLHYCSIYNSVGCALFLVSKGAETDSLDISNSTPLMLSISKGNAKLSKTLIELGANIEAKDKSGRTPLMYACQKGDKDTVEYLLSLNADPKIQTPLGDTAASIAQKGGFHDIALRLIQKNAPLKAPSNLGLVSMKKTICSLKSPLPNI